jgi:hypothetical protein
MAFAVLYVLVSPLVPTPNAVGKNNHSHMVVSVPAVSVLAALVAPHRSVENLPPSDLPVVEVLALTCTRLC